MINNEIWTGNKIGAEGARMISELLKTNTTLTELDLNFDEIEINEWMKWINNERKNEIKKWNMNSY